MVTDSSQAVRRVPSRLAVAAILVLLGIIAVLLVVLLNRSGAPGGVQPRAQTPASAAVTDYDGPGSDPTVTVVVKPGMNFHDIGALLQGSGVVRTDAAFVDAANKTQESTTLQAGSYVLHSRMQASLALAAMLSQKPGPST